LVENDSEAGRRPASCGSALSAASGVYICPGLANVVERRTSRARGESRVGGASLGDNRRFARWCFLPRHTGKGHRLSPADIDYRSNIDVLKRAGVTDLVSLSAAFRSRTICRPALLCWSPVRRRTHGAPPAVLRQGLRRPVSEWPIRFAAPAASPPMRAES